MIFLFVSITLTRSLSKQISSGWSPKWTTSGTPASDLGPAQVTFKEGVVPPSDRSGLAIVCPLMPRLWKVQAGDMLRVVVDGNMVGLADVLDVYR